MSEQKNNLTMSEKNEMAKNIFRRNVEKCNEGELKHYQVKYEVKYGNILFNLDISKIFINATSRELASFILMKYFDENMLMFGTYGESYQYYSNLEILFKYAHPDVLNGYSDILESEKNHRARLSDDLIKKLDKDKDGLKCKLFDYFVNDQFKHSRMWLEETEEPIILTMQY